MPTNHATGAAGMAALSALLALMPAAVQATAAAPEGGGYYTYAEVVEVSPRYGWHDVTEPVRQCIDVVEEPGQVLGWRQDGGYGYRHHRHTRYRDGHHPGDGAAGLVGGLIGGLIGHQFGGGNGKTALTIAGAALGASMARDHARRDGYRVHHDDGPDFGYAPARSVRRCTEAQRTRRVRGVNGYDVTYRYQGATFHKWVDEHPGEVIRVHVAVEPLPGH